MRSLLASYGIPPTGPRTPAGLPPESDFGRVLDTLFGVSFRGTTDGDLGPEAGRHYKARNPERDARPAVLHNREEGELSRGPDAG